MKIQLTNIFLYTFLLASIIFAETSPLQSTLKKAAVLRRTGNYASAKDLLSNALNDISAKTNVFVKAKIYNNLALVNIYQGNFNEAEKLLKITLQIRRENYNTNSLIIANTLNNLGSLYGRIGKYSEAEPLFLEALEIRKRKLDKYNYKIAESLNNLAAVYHVQKKYSAAEKLFREALIIINKNNDDLSIAAELSNLGVVCFYQKKYDEALEFDLKALTIRQKYIEDDSPVIAESLYNISKVYFALSNYFKAENYCRDALDYRKKTLGVKHPEFAETLTLLANILSAEGKSSEAENLLQQSLKIKTKILDKNHPDTIESLINLANLYSNKNQYNKAAKYYYDALNSLEDATKKAGGEFYSSQYRNTQRDICGKFLNSLYNSNTNKSAKIKTAFNAIELTSARLFLDELASIAANKLAGVNGTQAEKVEKIRNEIDIAYKENKPEIEISKLKVQLDKLEKQLSDNYINYAKYRNIQIVAFDDFINNTLKSNETFISFWLDKNNLSAVIISKNKKSFVSKTIDIKKIYHSIAKLIDIFEEEAECDDFKKVSYQLYQTLLMPFIENIDFSKTTTLFIVPKGILTAIPYEALITDTTGDDFRNLNYFYKKTFISYVPSATILKMIRNQKADKPNMNFARHPLLAFGDPIYTKKQAILESKKDSVEYTLNLKVNDNLLALVANDFTINKKLTRAIHFNDDGSALLNPLPGSKKEVSEIGRIFYNSITNNHTFTGGKAQESTFKLLNKNGKLKTYDIIHFATHGFLPGEIDGIVEPCLVLSIFGKNENEDGFLKMSEILNMNINADLITLSSCNSGIVDYKDFNEGLSGLARSFFFAGAKSLLVTLWSIDDDATILFMKNFYSNLAKGMTVGNALNLAREKMLESDFNHPGLWAPFVLNGEINIKRR